MGTVARILHQSKPFPSAAVEVCLGIRILAARLVAPWERHLKAAAGLTEPQFNVLRILRGSHPDAVPCRVIAERLIDRDPDVTRLLDRLETRRLIRRERSRADRRVVAVSITAAGLALLAKLDAEADRMPAALLGHLGAARLRELKGLVDAALDGLETPP